MSSHGPKQLAFYFFYLSGFFGQLRCQVDSHLPARLEPTVSIDPRLTQVQALVPWEGEQPAKVRAERGGVRPKRWL